MPFKQGKSGNPTGRPKGTPNKTTFDLREKMQELLESEFPKVLENFGKLEPKDQITLWLKLAEFVAPKMRYIEQDIEKVLYRVDGLPEQIIESDN